MKRIKSFSLHTRFVIMEICLQSKLQKIQVDICRFAEIGQQVLSGRIITNQVNLWSYLPKKHRKVKAKVEHNPQEFSTGRAWFGRMLVVGKFRSGIKYRFLREMAQCYAVHTKVRLFIYLTTIFQVRSPQRDLNFS